MLARFLKCEKSATAIEYALIAALIAMAIIPSVTAVGDELNDTFVYIAGKLKTR